MYFTLLYVLHNRRFSPSTVINHVLEGLILLLINHVLVLILLLSSSDPPCLRPYSMHHCIKWSRASMSDLNARGGRDQGLTTPCTTYRGSGCLVVPRVGSYKDTARGHVLGKSGAPRHAFGRKEKQNRTCCGCSCLL